MSQLAKSNVKKISGKNNSHVVQLITISTCIWCKRMRKILEENDVEYEYTDIDLLDIVEKNELKNYLRNYKTRLAFPMCFIDGKLFESGDTDDLVRRLK
ncbi:MAG: glutaredoxin [Candidatus Helarchaeota archaeon]